MEQFVLPFFPPSFVLDAIERNLREASSKSVVSPTTIRRARDVEYLLGLLFPYLGNIYRYDLQLSQRVALTTRNKMLQMLNECCGTLIPGNSGMYKSAYTIDNSEEKELH